MTNLYQLLVSISKDTWERMAVNINSKFSIGEETFTDNLFYAIYKFNDENPTSSIRLFTTTKPREAVNGNDFELIICLGQNKNILFPCQAKRLFKDGYNSINHESKKDGRQQINMLLEYAKKKKGIPLYLFYNYSDNTQYSPLHGCTLLSAHFLKIRFFKNVKFSMVKMDDIHPTAQPLVSITTVKTDADLMGKWGDLGDYYDNYKHYSDDALNRDTLWKELHKPDTDRSAATAEMNQILKKVSFNEHTTDFKPAFRIIIDIELLSLLPNHQTSL